MLGSMWAYLPNEVEERGADFLRIVSWIGGLVALSAFYHRSPARKAVRWLWRRNVADPFWTKWDASFESNTVRIVEPMIEAVKKAAREQHGEQNDRLTALEEAVTNPPPRSHDRRQDDNPPKG